MASNTEILIKRSLSTDKPSTLLQGELAYSYSSNSLFIGSPTGNGSIEIGGYRDFSANFTSGAGQYGNTVAIPVVTVAANGLITAIDTASISTTLSINGDSGGPSTVDLASQTLDVAGGSGLTSTVSGQTITLDVDDTVVRSNTAMLYQLIDGDVEISGNLIVSGNTTTIDVQTLNVADPLIYLAANNYSSDTVDIGFVGNYFDGSTQRHAGVYRHAGDKQFYIFHEYDKEPTSDTVNPADASFRLATLHTNLTAETANAATLHVANRIYGDTTNNTIDLVPSTSYGPGVNDQYIIIDPTAPNHIHLRAGGTIDGSTADLYLGGEETGVQVSDGNKATYVRANTHLWVFGEDASLQLPGDIYASSLPNATTSNLVYYDTANGRFSYASDNALTPTSIANGSYSLSISSGDGLLTTNGAGLSLANGAKIKDTSGKAVAFGEYAGTLSQGNEAVAIGDSAGYNTQGYASVAVGYGAGNTNQGQVAVAIGINAGMSNQGAYGVAIGNSAGGNQGQYGVAIGYDTGGSQGQDSIAIGTQAGKGNTSAIGVNTIAIGNKAGFESAVSNSIILNASGTALNSAAAGLYINPVRYTAAQDATDDGLMFYNASTKEVRYSYALDGGSF